MQTHKPSGEATVDTGRLARQGSSGRAASIAGRLCQVWWCRAVRRVALHVLRGEAARAALLEPGSI